MRRCRGECEVWCVIVTDHDDGVYLCCYGDVIRSCVCHVVVAILRVVCDMKVDV